MCMFPTIVIDIRGPQGNAYCIMGIVSDVLKQVGYDKNKINDIIADMKSSDYEQLCNVAKKYVKIIE